MEIILLEKIRNMGELGDRVRVKAGYGRNFLIPQNKAVAATEANVKIFEERRAELEEKAAGKLSEANVRAEKLNNLTITLSVMASDEGKLYGSIGTGEIAHAIVDAGEAVEKSEIILSDGAIRLLGEYEIGVQVHSDITAKMKLIVEAAK